MAGAPLCKEQPPSLGGEGFGMYVQKCAPPVSAGGALVVPSALCGNSWFAEGCRGAHPSRCAYPLPIRQDFDEPWSKENYILFFGRISHEKGIDLFGAGLSTSVVSARLVIIGGATTEKGNGWSASLSPIRLIGFSFLASGRR